MPKITNLFSEIIAIWIIACWESLERQNFNIVELGPGDGFDKHFIKVFQTVSEFNSIKKYFYLKKAII